MADLIDGKYEVLAKIKEGGMGAIYKVRHTLLDEICVVKTMKPHIEDDPSARKRFYQEARLAKSLKHPNVAGLLDFLEDQGHTFYMVMEFIDGVNLADYLHLNGPPPLDVTLEIAVQTLDALTYLHSRGVVHRDISPENLMLTQDADGRALVKLIDLGVAKDTAASEGMTNTGMFVGKLKYSSPEQLGTLKRGESIDGRSDLYSLGCVLYQLLTGEPPFLTDSHQLYILKHLRHPPRPFGETDPFGRVPDDVRGVVMRCLEKSRDDRWENAAQMAEALRSVRRGESSAQPTLQLMRKRELEPSQNLSSDQQRLAAAFAQRGASPGSSLNIPIVAPATVVAQAVAPTELRPTRGVSPWVWVLLSAGVLVLAAIGVVVVSRMGTVVVTPTPVVIAKRTGTLWVTATPPAEVSIDDKVVGTTPIAVEVEAGTRRLEFSWPDGVSKRYTKPLIVEAAKRFTAHETKPGFEIDKTVGEYAP